MVYIVYWTFALYLKNKLEVKDNILIKTPKLMSCPPHLHPRTLTHPRWPSLYRGRLPRTLKWMPVQLISACSQSGAHKDTLFTPHCFSSWVAVVSSLILRVNDPLCMILIFTFDLQICLVLVLQFVDWATLACFVIIPLICVSVPPLLLKGHINIYKCILTLLVFLKIKLLTLI